jgi:hypothetical protein
MFAKCPESWRRRYLEGDVIPPKVAMFKGRAVHSAAELNMKQKLESHVDLPVAEIVGAAVATFETCLKAESYELAPGESKATISKSVDTVAGMAEAHALTQAPEYQPKAVEHFFKIELPALTHDVVGYIDLITEDNKIVDLKTSKRAMSQTDTEASTQLSLYAAAMSDLAPELTVRLDVLIEGSVKRPVRRQVLDATRDKTDLPVIGRRLAVVSKTIDAGLFPPAPVGAWWCSESWCGYWRSCPYVNSERVAASRQIDKVLEILGDGV